jgi:photosystem II stability/assembly factor-like uncharacterized protein
MMAKWLRPAAAMAWCCLAAGTCLGATAPARKYVPEIPVTRVDRLCVIALTQVGQRLVAGGERGRILLSDDKAASWQSAVSPASATITAIRFSEGVGLAIGHHGTVLRSEDAGGTWQRVDLHLSDPPALFGLYLDGNHAIAVGSFATYLESRDAGRTWQSRKIIEGDFDWHLYGMARGHAGVLMIAGEAGTVLRSRDDGQTWQVLGAPYDGSYFGILGLRNGGVIIYGMRGHAYRSNDDGDHWQPIGLAGITSAIQGARELDDGSVLLYGNDGVVAVQEKGMGPFRIKRLANRRTAASMIEVGDRLLDAGPSGIHGSNLGSTTP